jgi:hypothetical protein
VPLVLTWLISYPRSIWLSAEARVVFSVFGVVPSNAESVPVAVDGVQRADQCAVARRLENVSLPNACCRQMSRVMSWLPSTYV